MQKKGTLSRRTVLTLLSALPAVAQTSFGVPHQFPESLAIGPTLPAIDPGADLQDMFAISGDQLITDEEHFGIVNGHLSVGVNYRGIATLSGLYAPPYASSDFFLELRVFGEKIRTEQYIWRPNEVRRKGSYGAIDVSTSTLLLTGQRAGVLTVTFHNRAAKAQNIPVQLNISGDLSANDGRISLDFVKDWGFNRPNTEKIKTTRLVESQRMISYNDAGAVVLAADFNNLVWSPLSEWSYHWDATVRLGAGERKTHYIAIALGPRHEAESACNELLNDPAGALQRSGDEFGRRTSSLFSGMPVFEASNRLLSDYYTRSVQHLLLNRWEVQEFALNPVYTTGSIKGGCLGCYLWDLGIPAEMLPIFDASAVRAHISKFLAVDISQHNRINPFDGQAYGGPYIVNQEKIIALIYYYVLHTGDLHFLEEQINGRSILDWVLYHATFGDDLSKPAILIDYGEDASHLELRHQYNYNHVLPDVNGGRYISYLRASKLTTLAGKPRGDIDARLKPLKELLKKTLWSSEHRWFGFGPENGPLSFRYTNIMFKLIGTGVLDADEERGLLSHLNEREFLSDYGLHSISKLDPAFDQADIDHGGGGSYVAFPGMIAEALYKGGYANFAEEILERVLWWGQRMPYWPDSVVANQIEYREDTPLQCAIDASSGAQCIVFGMCGAKVELNGNLVLNPHPPSFSPQISLRGLKIRGHSVDLLVDRKRYEVQVEGRKMSSTVGTPMVIPAAGHHGIGEG